MASSLCKSTVLKVYHEIMDDVVAGVRELFLEDGVDEQILHELKQSWETKLLATKAVDTQSEMEKQIAVVKKESTSNGQVFNNKNHLIQPQGALLNAATGSHVHQAPAPQLLAAAPSALAPTQTANNHTAPPQPTTRVSVGQSALPLQQSLLKQEPVPTNAHTSATPAQIVNDSKQVPIQITLPQQPGSSGPRVLTIQVPVSALQGNQLHKVLTGPVITATMGLPHAIASTLLQQHVNAAFNQHHSPPTAVSAIAAATVSAAGSPVAGNGIAHVPAPPTASAATSTTTTTAQNLIAAPKIAQGDAAYDDSSEDNEESSSVRVQKRRCRKNRHGNGATFAEAEAVLASVLSLNLFTIRQCDGNLMDTSDEDDEPSDEEEPSDEDYDNKDEEDQEMEDGGPEEEPLNSEDDVTDEDPSELFDTDNVVVCQYDKITRARNKWKFHLKDGIMNLNGEDYVFQKASGDAEW